MTPEQWMLAGTDTRPHQRLCVFANIFAVSAPCVSRLHCLAFDSGRENQMPIPGLSWREWLSALFHIAKEILCQRMYTRYMPKRIALPNLNSLTYIITGATSGIGLETAKQLAEAGAHVVLACRNVIAAEALVREWQKLWHGETNLFLDIEIMELNLLSLSSVRSFSIAWESRKIPLHCLINNAGIFSMLAPQKFSEDGFEEHMQVNHLAPALLTLLLLPSLLRASSSRIINVNSDMQLFGVVDPDDLHIVSRDRKYSNVAAYSGSKLAQIFFSGILQRKLPKDSHVHVICVSPGIVATNVTRTLPKFIQAGHHGTILFFSPVEGARSVLFCATDFQALEHAKELQSNGWPACPLFGSDCKPRIIGGRGQETRKALRVWDRTLEQVGIPNNFLETVLKCDDISPISKEHFPKI